MIHQLQADEWVATGAETALCRLPFTVAQAEQRFGLVFTPAKSVKTATPPMPDQSGQWHAVIEYDGQVYLVQAARGAPPPDHLLEVLAQGDVRYPEPLVAKICAAFKLAPQDLPWVSPDLGERRWVLWRRDDNNNRAVMGYFKDRQLAERVAQRYTDQGHKQFYGVEEALQS